MTSPALLVACLALAANPPDEAAPTSAALVVRIEVEPRALALDGQGDRRQLLITGIDRAGDPIDLTHNPALSLRIEPPHRAILRPGGLLEANGDGEATLIVAWSGQTASVPVVVQHADVPRPASYRHDVAALLSRSGCNMGACHGNLNGKGGFKLSLRGEDPDADYLALTRDLLGRRLAPNRPDRSLVLLKPTGQLPHEGGPRFRPHSPEAQLLERWIAAGAADDRDSASGLARLDIFPRERLLAAPGLTQQLAVIATFADGRTRDVTSSAAFEVSDPTRAEVSPTGQLRSNRPGEVAVAVRYLDGRATARIGFLAPTPERPWSSPAPRNKLDEHLFARLERLRVRPAPICDDPTFVRRAFLDVIGTLPTPDEARAFSNDPDPDKRAKLARHLVDRPEFAEFWALKWSDLLRNEERTMGTKGNWAFSRWLRDRIAADTPWDELARALIATTGSTWTEPATSFHRTNRDPESAAEATAQVFLGVRMQCARCHSHPFDVWTQADYYGLAAYFAKVKRKQIDNKRRDRNDEHEINGDEIVYLSEKGRVRHPRTGESVRPRPPGATTQEGKTNPPAPLDALADWLTHDNRQFARNLSNRIWAHLMGRGIVDPIDDFRDSNPASHPALLEALTDEFRAGGLRVKPLVVTIVSSAAYQLEATPNETNAEDPGLFARAIARVPPAEVLRDAIAEALQDPEAVGAVAAPQVNAADPFLRAFGKPARLMTCECERSEAVTLAQAFQMTNGQAVRAAVTSRSNRIGRLLDAGAETDAILDELTLATLTRWPTDAERAGFRAHIEQHPDRRRAFEDVAWALLNSKEFLLRH